MKSPFQIRPLYDRKQQLGDMDEKHPELLNRLQETK